MSIYQSVMRSSMAFLCTLSLWSFPAQMNAQCCQPAAPCCQPEEDCCNSGGGWFSGGLGSSAFLIGGAAVVGGIAGAIAGNASSGGRGHRGNRGPAGADGIGTIGPIGPAGPIGATGATGPGAFTPDTAGNTLTFNFGLTVTVGLLGGSTIIPFVTYPNGFTVTGPAIAVPIIGLLPPIAPIVISNLLLGTYVSGIQIVPGNLLPLVNVGLNLLSTVTASRDGITTAIGSPASVTAGLTLLSGNEIQVSIPFVYDDTTIPFP